MTLIQGATLGGTLQIMTSDTRRVHFVDVAGKRIEHRFTDTESKATRITPFCILGAGGNDNLADLIKEDLDKSDAVYIQDFFEPLKQSIKRLRSEEKYRSWIDDGEDNPGLIMIRGFNEDGTTGIIQYITGLDQEADYMQVPLFERHTSFITPSVDELDAIRANVKFENPGKVDGYMEACISQLAEIQYGVNTVNEEAVSEIFCYTAIFRDPESGEYRHFEGNINLKDTIKNEMGNE